LSEHVFRVRRYQRPFYMAWANDEKQRLIEIAHRRWGKDEIALNVTRQKALQRPASYWHCLPEYAQARKAIWTAVNPHTGKRRIDEAFPKEVRKATNEQEMFIELVNGSTWQLIGSDRYDATVGSSPAGIVYSEWALANPSAWGYHRPMVEENNGWAAFITTPRGNNHAKAMFDMARKSDRWFAELSTVNDTGALTAEQQAEAMKEYQSLYGLDFGLAMFEQEYHCSFSGAMVGAYWGAEINRAEREGRVTTVEIDPDHPVHTAWDLGKAVNNPIWCFQVIGGQPRIVDFYQPDSEDLTDWVAWLNGKGYNGNDYVPHDIIVTEWGSKRTRYDTLKLHGRKPIRIPVVSVADGIQAGRDTINRAVFANHERVMDGIEGMKNYRRDWDDERKTFRETPVKDWAEHIGSAFRYLGLAWKAVVPPKPVERKPTELIYQAGPDGRIVGNMSVREAVDAMVRRRKDRD
jgi:hypothetical protein